MIHSVACGAGAQVARLWGADRQSKPGVQMFMAAAEYKKDPAQTLAKLAAIGYGYVEAFAMAITNMVEFRKMLSDAGLGCPSGHFAFGFSDTERLLDDAATLGVHYVVASVLPPAPPKTGDIKTLFEKISHLTVDDFKRMPSMASTIAESAKKRGLEFAYQSPCRVSQVGIGRNRI